MLMKKLNLKLLRIQRRKIVKLFCLLKNRKWEFDATVEIDSETGVLNGIDIDNKSKEECISGIKVEKTISRIWF